MPQQPVKPEVMSPAGYWPQLHAAIEAGADSVYFGLKHFTARAKAGFDEDELPEAMRTLHLRGVKGYVTFNTLVFDHELDAAARAIAGIADAGADALIVQDASILRLAKEIAPGLELHASTQMSITDAAGVRFAQSLGVSRVTLARELSLADLRKLRAGTDCELEIFVHGALCVAYSGQCFSSEAWGGRSANRGQCAQACRLPYELIVDHRLQPLGDARYLLSPGDLFALRQIPEILTIGIHALKIEGRYKDADYVALATRAYRQAVDEAWAGLPLSITDAGELELEQVYSRGLGPWFLSGVDHQKVVAGRAPRHRGVLMGRVRSVQPESVVLEPGASHRIAPLKPGDGVVFDAAGWRSPEEPEEGGRIFEVEPLAGGLQLRFGNGSIDFTRIRQGDLLWRTDDALTRRAARRFTNASAPVARQKLHVVITATPGKPLRTEWTLDKSPNLTAVAESDSPLSEAREIGLTTELLREQFGRLGDTAYELGSLRLDLQGNPFAPISVLNRLRRDAIARLEALQSQPRRDPAARIAIPHLEARPIRRAEPKLHLLVRTPEQLDAAIRFRPASVTLDYLDLYGLRPSVEKLKAASLTARVASPRILKPGEERIGGFLRSLGCAILVRSAGLLEMLRAQEPVPDLVGDFSLNAANRASAELYLGLGLASITPTHDLNAAQVSELARAVGGARIEAIAYQHLPVFHTEHCVFCRFLSSGSDYTNCGRPCETHRVELRDAGGRSHPVLADVGCRNTVFGAEAQEASRHLEDWLSAGISAYRLEFAHESGGAVTSVAEAFQEALQGRLPAAQLRDVLRRAAPQGTTQGSLLIPADHPSLPILQ